MNSSLNRNPRLGAVLLALVLAPLLGSGAIGSSPALAQEVDVDAWRREIARARILFKKKQFAEALVALKGATADGPGSRDADALTFLGATAEELLDLPAARAAYRRAVEAGGEGAGAEEARASLSRLEGSLGEVTFSFSGWTPETGISLEFQGVVLDPRIKSYLSRLEVSFKTSPPTPGPHLLPAGTWQLAGVPFEVVAGEARTVSVVPPRKRPGRILLVALGAGSGWFGGAGEAGLTPFSGGLRLGLEGRLLTLPKGSLRVGGRGVLDVMGSESLGDIHADGETARGTATRVGGEVGVALDLRVGPRTQLIPAVGYGVSALSGAWFPATAAYDNQGQALIETGQLQTVALAHGPSLRMGVSQGRPTGPSLFLEGGLEILFAAAQSPGEGTVQGGVGGETFAQAQVTSSSKTFLTAGIRAGFAFRK